MTSPVGTSPVDPRLLLSEDQHLALTLRAIPAVARLHRKGDGIGFALGVLGAIALGGLTLVGLSHERTAAAETATPIPAAEAAQVATPTAPPPRAAPPTPVANPAQHAAAAPPAQDMIDPGQSRSMPMIIDNTEMASATSPAGATPGASAQPAGLNPDEAFALRTATEMPPTVQATALVSGRYTVVQGTIVPAVLETALNSDLPGYARAIVSRDVRGFDGRDVLIPRGSRLIGQYKSGLAAGQSRAYVMWTRLIRPDGISVQLGSPAMDDGSEIGLPGEVKRHFWQRFGASMLLSVVSGLASSLGDGSSVVVAGSGAQSAAGVALETDGKIPPTIRVPLGTPIQVFVARDLDFSAPAGITAAGAASPPSEESLP